MNETEIKILQALRDNKRAGYESMVDSQISEKVGKEPGIVAGYADGLARRGLLKRSQPTFDPVDNVTTWIMDMGLAELDRIGK